MILKLPLDCKIDVPNLKSANSNGVAILFKPSLFPAMLKLSNDTYEVLLSIHLSSMIDEEVNNLPVTRRGRFVKSCASNLKCIPK